MILPENRFPVFGIMRHCRARPGAKPLEPFGKGSNALKAGTPDAGPESPTVQEQSQERASARPSVQPPAGVERKRALYAAYPERQGHAKQHLARPCPSLFVACQPTVIALTSVSWRYFSRLPCARRDLQGANR